MRRIAPLIKNWVRLAVARHPLFVAALIAVACVIGAAQSSLYGIIVAVICGLAGCFFKSWKLGIAWLSCGLLAAGVVTWRMNLQATTERNLAAAAGGEFRAKILANARGNRIWSAPAKLLSGPNAGAKVRWLGTGEVPVAGAIVQGRGNFGPLPVPENPGEFDEAAWLRNQGIAAEFDASNIPAIVETGDLARLAAGTRAGFRAAVTLGLEEESVQARVIRAIVIGELPQDSEVLVAAFRNSGTLHAFSVSGLHVAMVGSIAWVVLRMLRVPRRWAILILIPMVFGYSWITGNSQPAVRSAWMAAVFLGAFIFRRRPDLLNALGAVLLAAMLWDGRLLFQPGVQLSYGVVAAISIGMAWATRVFSWIARPELHLPLAEMNRWQHYSLRVRTNLASSLGVSLAAGVGSTPLTAYHFGLVTPISILAGIVLIPMVFVLLSAALLATAFYPIAQPVTRLINQVNGKTADITVATADMFASIPGGHFQISKTRTPQLLIYKLDHGDAAACFSAGGQGAMLFDCGGRSSFKYRVMPSLRRLGITPDSVVISHPDGGHLGGGAAVWEAFPIRQALLPVEISRSPALKTWVQKAPTAGIRILQTATTNTVPLPDGARLEVLHAPDPLDQNALADKRVAIFRLHWHGWKILFTSDSGIITELALLESEVDLSSDIIIAGRHDSDLYLTDDFVAAVNPQVIIPSNARFPVEQRLETSRIDFWKRRKIHVIDPLEAGGITITHDPDGKLRLYGFLNDSTLLLRPR